MKTWMNKLHTVAWAICTGYVLLRCLGVWVAMTGDVVGSDFGLAIMLNHTLAMVSFWGVWTYLRFHLPIRSGQ